MSEQVITDTDAQQTDVRGFLRKMRHGEPLNTEATSRLLNRIFNIFESISGEGCTVEKPLDRNGQGWRIVIDGKHSDNEPGGDDGRTPMPFELVYINNAWHVWLKDAEVVVNNFHASRANDLALDGSGSFSAASFVAGQSVYLYVSSHADADGVRHGENSYTFGLATSTQAGAIASIQLGYVSSGTTAEQYTRGNQIIYTIADSEIIKRDNSKAVMHIDTTSASALTVDENLAFVVRHGGMLWYYPASELIDVAFEKTKELMRVHDEGIWLHWATDVREAIKACMEDGRWPFQPECNEDFIGESDWERFDYFAGIGFVIPFPMPDAGKIKGSWIGIDDQVLHSQHLPPRSDLNTINGLLLQIKAKLDAIEADPDGDGPQTNLLYALTEKANELIAAAADLESHVSSLQSQESAIQSKLAAAYMYASQNQAHYAQLQARMGAIDDDVTALEGAQ